MTAVSIPYSLTSAGNVSLAVYNAAGQMVREILRGVFQEAGAYSQPWDGCDRYGVPQPNGDYPWKILVTPGFQRFLVANVGAPNIGSPVAMWPGNHFGASCVAVGGGNLYVGSSSSEGPPHLMAMTLDGITKLWDSTQQKGYDVLPDGMAGLAYLQPPPSTVSTHSQNFQVVWQPAIWFLIAGSLYCWDAAAGGSLTTHIAIPNYGTVPVWVDPVAIPGATSFCAGRGGLIVGCQSLNQVLFIPFLAQSAGVATDIHAVNLLDLPNAMSVSVPSPGPLCCSPDGIVFVISASGLAVVGLSTIDLANNVTLVRSLPATSPVSLDYDPCFDDILVAYANCVKRYQAPDGGWISTHGKPGGRQYGTFNPLDFAALTGVCADGAGGFVTVEQSPRRVAHFTGRLQHSLVNENIGGLQWGSVGCLDPADPTISYQPIDPQHIGRCKIAPDGTWTLTHLYAPIDQTYWNVGKGNFGGIVPAAGERKFWECRHVGSHTYLLNRGAGTSNGNVLLLEVDTVNHRLMPLSWLTAIPPNIGSATVPWTTAVTAYAPWWTAAVTEQLGSFSLTHSPPFASFAWNDTNGNGLFDFENEIEINRTPGYQGFASMWSAAVDASWNVYWPGMGGIVKVPNTGTLVRPFWDWNNQVLLMTPGYQPAEVAIQPGCSSSWVDENGGIYLCVRGYPTATEQADVPPLNWPDNAWNFDRLMKFSPSGQQIFSVGVHSDTKFPIQPGNWADLRHIIGEVNQCVVVMDAVNAASVWTEEGLYAGSFLDDLATNNAFPYSNTFDDNQWGQLTPTSDGNCIWGNCNATFNSTAFFKITGWQGWQRQSGTITLAGATGALGQGTGLTRVCPIPGLTDPVIWFGPLMGDHRLTTVLHPLPPGSLSWTGSIEPIVSEQFQVIAYCDGGASLSLTVNGIAATKVASHGDDKWAVTLPLTVGQKVPICLIYLPNPASGANAGVHLYWQSMSEDQRHIPTKYLYPQ